MGEETIGIAVIGAGRAGLIHARNLAARVPGARLVAIADPVEDACRTAAAELRIARYHLDYREVLRDEEIHAVVVVTPTVVHRDIVVAAARAGKHIFCEKPMAMNVSECREMIEAARAARVKLQIGFMRRFDPSFVAAYDAIRNGAIGDIVLVKSLTHGPSVPQPWMYDIGKSNGPLAEVSSHDIDTLRWFSGSELEEVYAIAGNYRCPQARGEYPDFYDNFVMTVRFANGMQGLIEGAASVSYGYDARLEVLGTTGVVHAGTMRENTVEIVSSQRGVGASAVRSWRSLFARAYEAEDAAFVNAVLGDEQPRVTGRDGLMAVAVVNAGNESITRRAPVKVSAV